MANRIISYSYPRQSPNSYVGVILSNLGNHIILSCRTVFKMAQTQLLIWFANTLAAVCFYLGIQPPQFVDNTKAQWLVFLSMLYAGFFTFFRVRRMWINDRKAWREDAEAMREEQVAQAEHELKMKKLKQDE